MYKEKIDSLPVDVFGLVKNYASSINTVGEISKKLEIPRYRVINRKDADVFYYNGEYKIIYNELVTSSERIRWTIMHEIAHIVLGHLKDFEQTRISRGGLTEVEYAVLEREADFFTAEVLVPRIVMNKMNVHYSGYIQSMCAISEPAAKIRARDIWSGSFKWVYNKYEAQILQQFEKYMSTTVPRVYKKYRFE